MAKDHIRSATDSLNFHLTNAVMFEAEAQAFADDGRPISAKLYQDKAQQHFQKALDEEKVLGVLKQLPSARPLLHVVRKEP